MSNRSTRSFQPVSINREQPLVADATTESKGKKEKATGLFAKSEPTKSVGEEISGAMLRANAEADDAKWRKAG